jgi:nitrous oxide reductase
MDKTQTKLSRRNFLLAATAGTAATAAALVGKTQTDSAAAKESEKERGKGYQATEHVRNYYRTARI